MDAQRDKPLTWARVAFGVAVLATVAVPALGRPAQQDADYAVPELRLAPVSGTVLVRAAGGARYRRLTRARVLPFGTLVDARRGRVRITVSPARVEAYDGKFAIYHDHGLTTLYLKGGSFACASIASKADAGKRRRVRRLWANGKGRFRTRGRYSAASVRGTWWLVEDRCDGTLTRVRRGEVEVEDFTVPEPTPTPSPTPEGQSGTQPVPGAAAPQPVSDRAARPRRVRVKRGRSYVARPR